MTAFAIRRIVDQLRAEGRLSAAVVCPICEGGSRRRRTLSVDYRDGVWLYLCHRGTCSTKGAIPDRGERAMPERPAFVPTYCKHRLRLPMKGDGIVNRRGFGECEMLSRRHGLRVLEDSPDTHYWPLLGLDTHKRAWQTRTENKRIMTHRTLDRPVYGAFFPFECGALGRLLIVEDPLSAALAAECGVHAVALCGTNLAFSVAQEMRGFPRIVVALDNDEAGIKGGRRAVATLMSAGVRGQLVIPPMDFKDMTWEGRSIFIKEKFPSE